MAIYGFGSTGRISDGKKYKLHVNLQCILTRMNYIAGLGQMRQKNCAGLYVRQQKVNGRLRMPDAAGTLLPNTQNMCTPCL